MLDLKSIVAEYGHVRALKGISLAVERGEIVALLGANGAGKSTALKCVSGLLRVVSGTISFEGRRIDPLPPHRIIRLGISQVMEGRRLFPDLDVMENLRLGAYLTNDRQAIQRRMERVFSYFPILAERKSQLASTFSGGEQQMLAMGRALMSNPRLLLLDEPSMGLAPVLVDSIFDTIGRLHAAGTTLLLVEQNARMALQVAGRGYVLQTGAIVLSDTAENLRRNESVRRAYLGEGAE